MTVEVSAAREGAIFRVKVQPGAPRDKVRGEAGGALKVAVAAPPEKGKANAELVRFLGEALGIDRRALEVASGEASRDKRILVRGATADRIAERLAALVAQAGGTARD